MAFVCACGLARGGRSFRGGGEKGASASPPDRWPKSGRGESLSRAERLRRGADYLRCYRKGRRRHGTFSVLHSVPNDLVHPRLGITVSRKVGRAVTRFRLKRRIREIYRRWSERSRLPAFDLVVHVKPPAAQASFAELEGELRSQFSSLLPKARRGS